MTEIRDHYLSWLRDAHAMEEQALGMMRGMTARLRNYPEFSARIERHIAETERQAAALDRLLEERDTSSSVMKDAMGKMAAAGQTLGGLFTGDEVVKGALASYTFEHMEIASYKVLLSAARQLDDTAALPVFEQILAEEQAMADWLSDHLEEITHLFLLRGEADLQAKR